MTTNLNAGSKVRHENFGNGIVKKVEDFYYKIDFGPKGLIDISKNNEKLVVVEESSADVDFTDDFAGENFSEFEKKLIGVLEKYNALQYPIELGERWAGGKLVLQPENESLKPKEMPIETFFHKIVMVRDRLRVLEQNINSHDKLSDEDKVNLQQYITRIYGSFTSFNILFRHKEDYFEGEKSK